MMHGSISSEFKLVQSDLGMMKLTIAQLTATMANMNNLFIAFSSLIAMGLLPAWRCSLASHYKQRWSYYPTSSHLSAN
jgi:hypothetical protein